MDFADGTGENVKLFFLFGIFLALGANLFAVECACGNVGASCTLTASIANTGATCLSVTAASVSIDCQGFSITGDNTTSTYGISTNQFNTTIKNCVISNYSLAVYTTTGAYGATIRNNTLDSTFSNGAGLYLEVMNTSVVDSNRISSNSGNGLFINSGSLIQNLFENNSISSNTGFGVQLRSNSNTFRNNNISSTSNSALVSVASNCIFDRNNFTNVGTATAVDFQTGSAGNNLFENNSITSSTGKALSVGGDNNFTNNSLYSASNACVQTSGQPRNNFKNNIFNGTWGLDLRASDNSTFNGNIFQGRSNFAVELFQTKNASFVNNTFLSSNNKMVYLTTGSNYNYFYNNTGNGSNGYYVETTCNNNTIVGNVMNVTAGPVIIQAAHNNTITSNNWTCTSQFCFQMSGASANNTITFNNDSSGVNYKFYLTSTGLGNLISHNYLSTGISHNFYISNGANLNITDNDATSVTMDGTAASNYIAFNRFVGGSGINFQQTGAGNIFANNNYTGVATNELQISSTAALNVSNNLFNCTYTGADSQCINFAGGDNVSFINNTVLFNTSAGTKNAINIVAGSAYNLFSENNISSGLWITNLNETNMFNTTTKGNIYHASNGTGAWLFGNGTTWQDTNGDGYADTGTLPCNATICPTFISGLGGDFHPFTNNTLTNPVFTFNFQTPADLNTTNALFGANISYNISGSLLNTSSARLNVKVNSSAVGDVCWQITNGTALCGYSPTDSAVIGNGQYNWSLDHEELLPSNLPLASTIFETETPIQNTLSASSQYVKAILMNISNATQNNEVMCSFISNSTALQSARFYTCNQSALLTTGNVLSNPNCVLFADIAAPLTTFTLTESLGRYQSLSYPINTTTGAINGVSITPNMSILMRGRSVASDKWYWYAVPNISFTGQTQTTSDNGLTWVNYSGTFECHIHQYNATMTTCYYPSINTTTPAAFNGTERCDILEQGNMPPSSPSVYSPTNTTYNQLVGNISINWTACFSPNNYPISAYRIELYNGTDVFNRSIANVSGNTLGYSWDASAVPDGQWNVHVFCNDTLNQTSFGESRLFDFLSTTTINCSITYPQGTSKLCDLWQQLNITCNDNNIGSARSITAYQYWQNGTLRDSKTADYVSGVPVMFNFTLTSADAGGIYNSYNATGNFSGVKNNTTTMQLTVVGIGQSDCAGGASFQAQNDGTVIFLFMVACFLVCMMFGSLTIYQTGYLILILVVGISVFAYNTSVEIGQAGVKQMFEVSFILSSLLLAGATLWYLYGILRMVMENWLHHM